MSLGAAIATTKIDCINALCDSVLDGFDSIFHHTGNYTHDGVVSVDINIGNIVYKGMALNYKTTQSIQLMIKTYNDIGIFITNPNFQHMVSIDYNSMMKFLQFYLDSIYEVKLHLEKTNTEETK